MAMTREDQPSGCATKPTLVLAAIVYAVILYAADEELNSILFALVLGAVALTSLLWGSERYRDGRRDGTGLILVAAVAGLLAVALVGWALQRQTACGGARDYEACSSAYSDTILNAPDDY